MAKFFGITGDVFALLAGVSAVLVNPTPITIVCAIAAIGHGVSELAKGNGQS